MRNLLRNLDWRFFMWFTASMFSVAFMISVASTSQANKEFAETAKTERAARVEIQNKSDRTEKQLLQGQEELKHRYDLLLIYMEDQGYAIPDNLKTPEARARELRLKVDGGGGSSNGDSKSGSATGPSGSVSSNGSTGGGSQGGGTPDSGGAKSRGAENRSAQGTASSSGAHTGNSDPGKSNPKVK